jgi:CubicO group peptidase (beta-lactamase class C family)
MENPCFAFVSPFLLRANQRKKAEVDKIFAEWNKSDVPGGALGIIKDGKLVYANGYGSR